MDERLARLAQLKGIVLAYDDVWSGRHAASPATLVSLLRAMGVDATDRVGVDAAIAAVEEERWSRMLPPVLVCFEHGPPCKVRLNFPVGLDAEAIEWRIDEESGGQRRGDFVPRSLPELERGQSKGRALVARELELAERLTAGYHQLTLRKDGVLRAACRLIVAPDRCYLPPALKGDGRVWGATAQVYSLRSEHNWGIGDFSDLSTLLELWGLRGAGIIGVSPLHALFPHDPAHASPYSPSNRHYLNTLYLDVEAIDDYREDEGVREMVRSAEFQRRLQILRAADLVDYPAVAAVKRQVFEHLFAHFHAAHLRQETERARAFNEWRAQRGEGLHGHALFEALQEHFHDADARVWGWPAWPAAYRHPRSPDVAQFARDRIDRVTFYEYLQWQADLQLGAIGRRSFELGLGVGLYADLAVSVDRAGAEAWLHQDLYALDASIGAPPDDFNQLGQDWGLPPPDPNRLWDSAYAPFIGMLRANMQHAGALRIDHVMALMRLYWIPGGAAATDGAYVQYRFDDLLGIVSLESTRNRCVVVGEDLGTVPEEVRTKLATAGVLSYRLLYFERRPDGDFVAPEAFPRQALVAASTHDLPTLAGWWEGRDLVLRESLGLFSSRQTREEQVVARAQDRARLLLALERENLLPPGVTVDPVSIPHMIAELCGALHRLLARSPAYIVVAQLEDVIGAADQINLPGTIEEHPNWRRKLSLPLENWPGDAGFVNMARSFEHERGSSRAVARPRESVTAVIPRATYRVQLDRDFGFAAVGGLVPYLARLGISHVYCSPFLRARAGSRHGYDIVDHNQLNPEIGSRDDFQKLAATLRQHGMGMLIDVVPNHMGVLGADNGWWMDVLENGPASVYADYFDIDWRVAALSMRVLLPILGDHYGVVLERGELQLEFEPQSGNFRLHYHEHLLPIDPALYPRVLSRAASTLPPAALEAEAADTFASVLAAFGHLPPRDTMDAALRAERHRDKEMHKANLARLVREHRPLAAAIGQALTAFNGTSGEAATFDDLDSLLEAQAYRLAFWRVAAEEINYRRFFDINDLAALRVENAEVFDATHRLVLDLAARGQVDGFRIDHPDGLYDPAGYFRRLQERYAQLVGLPGAASASEGEPPSRPLYVVAEKIVASHEQLPLDWAVHGTTGYRFANLVNGLFIDGTAKARLERAWRAFVGAEAQDFEDVARESRRLVMATSLAGELSVLAAALLRLARADRRTRDFTLNALRQALEAVVSNFPVYRTYIVDQPSEQDRRYIDWAVARARRTSPAADTGVFAFVHSALLGQVPLGATDELRARYLLFARRLQQFTAPVMAKGVEDTAFYRHHRLASLNEVGGDPDTVGITVSAFHGASRDRRQHWPHTMLTTSTHDTKRSADVRARLDVISEMPAAWRLMVRRWGRLNRRHRREIEGAPAPARNDEYLLYQTLVGTLPVGLDEPELLAYRQRIESYLLKAAREAKVRTSWIAPNSAYEAALSDFVGALLGRLESNAFLEDLRAAASTFAWFGALNSIAMSAIKLTSPGVPDLYQGEEMIELALVDPDSRRAVDYEVRRRELDRLQRSSDATDSSAQVRSLLESAVDGRAKLWTIWRVLQLRRERADLFDHGDYTAVKVTGVRSRHVVAYARRKDREVLWVVCGRLLASLGTGVGRLPVGDVWGDTLADASFFPVHGRLTDVLSGTSFDVDPLTGMPVAKLLAHFPVAVLHGEFHDHVPGSGSHAAGPAQSRRAGGSGVGSRVMKQ
jgi:(1->4)-alpha-D-glucan 1-alpha-D-glucosylmutase